MVNVVRHSPGWGCHASKIPAKRSRASSAGWIHSGSRLLLGPRHSKNPSAGTTQRRFSNASRNDGSWSTVSAFALMHIEARLASFAQLFTKPQGRRDRFAVLVLGFEDEVGLRRSDIEPWC